MQHPEIIALSLSIIKASKFIFKEQFTFFFLYSFLGKHEVLTLAICFIFQEAEQLRPCLEKSPEKFWLQVQAMCGCVLLLFVVAVALPVDIPKSKQDFDEGVAVKCEDDGVVSSHLCKRVSLGVRTSHMEIVSDSAATSHFFHIKSSLGILTYCSS